MTNKNPQELRITRPVFGSYINKRRVGRTLISCTTVKNQTIIDTELCVVGVTKSVLSGIATDNLSIGHLYCINTTSIVQSHIRNSNISIYKINSTTLSSSIIYNTILSGGTDHILKSKIDAQIEKCAFINTIFYNIDFNYTQKNRQPTFRNCSFSGCTFIYCSLGENSFENCDFSPETPLGIYGNKAMYTVSYPNLSVVKNKAIGCIAPQARLRDLGLGVSFINTENSELLEKIKIQIQPLHNIFLAPTTTHTIPNKSVVVEKKHAYFFSTTGI